MVLVGLASGTVGGIIGFLFGLPRQLSTPTPATTAPAGESVGSQSPGASYRLSGYLSEVADWLTKIIVGLGLVEARGIYGVFSHLSSSVSNGLFEGSVGSSLVIPAVMVASAVLGFLYAYMLGQLFLSSMIAETDASLGKAKLADSAVALGTSPIPIVSVSRIGGLGGSSPLPEPSSEQKLAAERLRTVPRSQATTLPEILTWARGRFIDKRYTEAADAYRELWPRISEPQILFEAVQALSRAGDSAEAMKALRKAGENLASLPADRRGQFLSLQTNQLLFEPDGYKLVLALLDDNVVREDADGQLHILRACARGQAFNELAKGKTAEEQAVLKKESWPAIAADLKEGLRRPANREWVRYLADTSDERKGPPNAENRDNDLEAFSEEINQLLNDIDGQPSSPPASPSSTEA